MNNFHLLVGADFFQNQFERVADKKGHQDKEKTVGKAVSYS